jgi:hypothetical protein
MDFDPNTKPPKSKQVMRKSSLQNNFPLKSQKTRRLSHSNDEKLLKIYGKPQNIKRNSGAHSTLKPNFKRIKPELEISSPHLNRLPDIKKSVTPSHFSLGIAKKEDKLSDLIDNFIVNRSPRPRYTRLRNEIRKSLELKKDDMENLVYEKNIDTYRGREMKEYKNSVQKNMKIEKIRNQNHKRLKKKMKEF